MDVSWSTRLDVNRAGDLGPLVAVVNYDCGNQTFTHEVNGGEPVVLETGDGHDSAFDEHKEQLILGEGLTEVGDIAGATAIGCTGEKCSSQLGMHEMLLYPTAEFEESFQTRQPRIFAGVVISGFALLFGMFLLHDCIVQRHQHRLKESAVQSDAIVSSLFPSTVKQQLCDNCNNNDNVSLTDPGDSHSLPDDVSVLGAHQGPPIAEHCPASTILFADIAGFTKWSSSRPAADVFEFLERLCGGFDQSALAHGVFKIETAGDCYVAASGTPEPRPDHAVIMVQFAKDMLQMFKEVIQELGEKLQAHNLGLRVGMHSGPVIAGVLRGEKARFQLFGDTVNATARHESGGKPGCIHISKETAALLKHAGNENWIKPRKDSVCAKGKGCLETCWVIADEAEVAARGCGATSEWGWGLNLCGH